MESYFSQQLFFEQSVFGEEPDIIFFVYLSMTSSLQLDFVIPVPEFSGDVGYME